jgi:hypothetical protein
MIAPAARMMLLATASFRKLRFLMIAYTALHHALQGT